METTLVLLKPDCIADRHVGDVISRFEKAGFRIRGCRMFRPNSAFLREHYAHVADKPFYPSLEAFMLTTPVIALAIAGTDAINAVRALIGPTDSQQAPKGTVRGDFGRNKMINIAHSSDSPESAEVEIRRFFRDDELFDFETPFSA